MLAKNTWALTKNAEVLFCVIPFLPQAFSPWLHKDQRANAEASQSINS